jgi:hypothetical protein
MPIDEARLKQLFTRLFTELKVVQSELQVFHLLFDGLNEAYPEEGLAGKVEELRRNPLFHHEIHAKYDARLAAILKSIDNVVADQDLDALLRGWTPDNPKRPIN